MNDPIGPSWQAPCWFGEACARRVTSLSAVASLSAVTSLSVGVALVLAGCAPQRAAVVEPHGAAVGGAAVGAPAGSDSRGALASETTTSNRADTDPMAPTAGASVGNATAVADTFTWPSARLDSRPASHLAAGKRRVAAIVTDPETKRRLVVFELPPEDRDASHVKVRVDVPLPSSLQTAADDSFALFMGRDDWPRIIITPPPSPGAITYHRYRPNEGWKSPADEQGALAAGGRAAGYYGVLGHVDPEVLCVPDKACYEKRTSGWTKRAVPGAGVWHVELASEVADPADIEAWAWSPDADGTLLQLNGEWRQPLPRLKEPLVGLATWGHAYFVALTTSGLYRHAPPTSEKGAAGQGSSEDWSLIAKVEGSSVLFGWPLLRVMLVGTKDNLFQVSSPTAQLTKTVVTLDTNAIATGKVSAIGATLEGWPRYWVACDAGVLLLGDVDRDPRGAL